jgi:hypothetical protein
MVTMCDSSCSCHLEPYKQSSVGLGYGRLLRFSLKLTTNIIVTPRLPQCLPLRMACRQYPKRTLGRISLLEIVHEAFRGLVCVRCISTSATTLHLSISALIENSLKPELRFSNLSVNTRYLREHASGKRFLHSFRLRTHCTTVT